MLAEAAAVTDPTPWWGVPILAGTFTILGVLTTQWTTWVLDRRKARREDQARWHADRRAVYSAYVAAMDNVFRETSAYLFHASAGTESERAKAKLSGAIEAVVAANLGRQDLHLLASQRVRDAADRLWQTPGTVLIPPERPEGERPTRDAFRRDFAAQLSQLMDAMRHELGTDRRASSSGRPKPEPTG